MTDRDGILTTDDQAPPGRVPPAGDPHHVLAASAATDDRTRVLKHGDTFAVFDHLGQIKPGGLGEEGLYQADGADPPPPGFVQGPQPGNSAADDDEVRLGVPLTGGASHAGVSFDEGAGGSDRGRPTGPEAQSRSRPGSGYSPPTPAIPFGPRSDGHSIPPVFHSGTGGAVVVRAGPHTTRPR